MNRYLLGGMALVCVCVSIFILSTGFLPYMANFSSVGQLQAVNQATAPALAIGTIGLLISLIALAIAVGSKRPTGRTRRSR